MKTVYSIQSEGTIPPIDPYTKTWTSVFAFAVLLIFPFLSCGQEVEKEVYAPPGTYAFLTDIHQPTVVPDSLRLDPFYQKYISADGIPIVSSAHVSDSALVVCRKTVLYLLARIPDVKDILLTKHVKIAIIGSREQTTDIPEYRALNQLFPDTDWDRRTRGVSATTLIPVSSCAEENLLCFENDPYKGEDILVHEFAHTIHTMGLRYLDTDFDKTLQSIYRKAKREGLWEHTYAMTNYIEYFAEGVQSWFNVNREANPADGVHNAVNTRAELKQYDIRLYNFITRYFYADDKLK